MKTTLAALGGAVALCLGLTACGGGGDAGGVPLASGGAPQQAVSKDGLAGASNLQAAELADIGLSLTAQTVDVSRNQDRPSDAVRPSGADRRNGVYAVYAANGTEQSLFLNFDAGTYMMTDTSSQGTAGTFSQDPLEPGVWVFDSPRITATVNTARFQVTDDAIVGSFPFRRSDSTTVAHAVQPFVAVRAFVTDRWQLDGVYNVVGVAVGPVKGFSSSQVQQISIDGGGTQLKFCMYTLLYPPGGCAGTGFENYWVTRDPAGAWLAIRPGSPRSQFKFRMARIGGQNVFLAANPFSTPGYPIEDYQRLSIGFPDVANWQDPLKARIYTSDGGRGTAVLDAKMYGANTLRPDATLKGFAYNAKTIAGTQGMQQINVAGNERFFAIRNTKLVAVVGSPGNLDTRGYLQIGLIDGPIARSARSGTYSVFAGLGSQHNLTIDLEAKSYGTVDEAGVSASGTLTTDPAETGTYVFSSSRIAALNDTARFRAAGDTVVGAFPFQTRPLGDQYQVQPFIASRAVVNLQSAIDGTYNRFSLVSDSGFPTLRFARQVRVANGGTTMLICDDYQGTDARYTVDNCPTELKTTFVVSPGATAGSWRASIPNLPPTSPNFLRRYDFSIVEVAGQKVYVAAGYEAAVNTTFSIGLEEAVAWQAATARGASTKRNEGSAAGSRWNNITLDAAWLDRTIADANGTQSTEHLAIGLPDTAAPQGVRPVGSYPNINRPQYMIMQNRGLIVMSSGLGVGTDFGVFLNDRADQ